MSPITRTARTGTLLFAFILLSAISFAQFDDCATPTSLTPNTTCVTTQASLFNATSSGIPGSCAGTKYDVWYTFTTPTGCTSVNIDVADVAAGGSSIDGTNTFIEVFSGTNCSATTIGACTPMGTTLTLTGLSPSTNYHLRVFTTTNPTSGNSGKWDFDICVTYSPPPTNDDCPGAITLPSGTSCVNTGGTLINATASGGLPVGCESAGTHYDVWYKFVATTTTHTVTISGLGANVTNPKIQLYSGSCGTLTSLACGTTSLSSASLSTLSTYYIRVSNIGSSPASNGGFNICVTNPTPPVTVVAGKMNEVYRQTIISPANALADPWEITYGPDNYLWITEAKGYKVNRINPVSGAKQVVLDVSQGSTFLPTADQTFNRQFDIAANNPQGGFAGLALHPNFTGTAGGQNYVYVSYVHTWISGVAYINRIVRFFYNTSTNRLESPVSICDTIPGSGDHNSQRMIIAPMTQGGSDYYLFYASGDMGAGQQFPTSANITRPQKAQVINSYEGKILRFALSDTCSGTGNQKWIPATNPYNDVAPIVGKSAVWCTGIRNNQGFAYNPELNILYGASHGAFSDDEINIIEGFKNYGHPLIVGYADGNYNGTTTPGLSTSISAGVPFGYTGGAFTVDGQAAAAGTCPPIGNEVTNMNNINANAVLYGTYKDPLFSAYPGPASGTGSVSTIWSAATTPGGAGWHSEAWSGLDLYTNTYIPGWKNSLLAAGLKWGRTIRLKLNATGTAVIPTAGADTATYFQSGNRYRDIAFSPNGRDIYLSMDRSPAGSAGTVGNPPATVGNCLGCVVRYEFLGYAADATALAGSTISKSIDVADGAANSISNGTTVTINAENGNTNYWVPITGPDGNIMAEIYANGNNLGTVTSSFYKNSGGIRSAPGIKYLDRNITITPQFQPTLPLGSPLVKIRLYISKTEFDALDADPLSGISSINDLRILKNDDPCSSAIIGASTLFNPINTLPADLQHGTNGYVLQTSISSFSSFYFASNNITVLPLDLLTFTGTLQTNNSVLLNWKTENEVNTSHFVIERSADGIRYGGIGNVTANGRNNRGGSFSYAFTDNDAINQSSQRLYYRLKMVDIDGNFKYSNIISVSFPLITGRLSISPNPVLTSVKVAITSEADGRVQWKLTDNVGKVIQTGSEYVRKGAGNNFTINMNRLSTGTYNLSVTGAGIDQNVKMQKL